MQNIKIYNKEEVVFDYEGVFGNQVTSHLFMVFIDETTAIVHPIKEDWHIVIENLKMTEEAVAAFPDNVVPLN